MMCECVLTSVQMSVTMVAAGWSIGLPVGVGVNLRWAGAASHQFPGGGKNRL